MGKVILLLLLLLFPKPLHAEPSEKLFRASLVAAVTAHGMDLSTSMYALGQGQVHEENFFLRPFQDKPLAFGMVKMGVASMSLLGTWHLWKLGHKKTALGVALGQAALYGYLGVRNAHYIHKE